MPLGASLLVPRMGLGLGARNLALHLPAEPGDKEHQAKHNPTSGTWLRTRCASMGTISGISFIGYKWENVRGL